MRSGEMGLENTGDKVRVEEPGPGKTMGGGETEDRSKVVPAENAEGGGKAGRARIAILHEPWGGQSEYSDVRRR